MPLEVVRDAVAGHGDAPAVAGPAAPTAAVLAPVFEEDGEARVILTRRTAWLRAHAGQVAFPGGRVEPGETLVDAALREASEEIGLDPGRVEVVGRLSRLRAVAASPGFTIHPFVGLLPARPELVPNPGEVERVFDVGLRELMDDGVFREERWGVGEAQRPVFFFEVGGETVWGATAAVLHELLVLVTGGRRPGTGAGVDPTSG